MRRIRGDSNLENPNLHISICKFIRENGLGYFVFSLNLVSTILYGFIIFRIQIDELNDLLIVVFATYKTQSMNDPGASMHQPEALV